jgi:arylsulfatase A-like enzyme
MGRAKGSWRLSALKALFIAGFLGVLAGLLSGLAQVRAHQYSDQGLGTLVTLTLVEEVNAWFLKFLFGFLLALLLFAAFHRVTRSARKAALALLCMTVTIAALVAGSNAIFYLVGRKMVAGHLAQLQRNLPAANIEQLIEPFRKSFWGVYGFLATNPADYGLVLLALGLVALSLGCFAAWGAIRILARLRPGLFSGEAIRPPAGVERLAVRLRPLPWAAAALGLVVLVSANAAARHTRQVSRRALEGKPNVIIVSVDTLRADHVGRYGYGRETTPTLDRLAQEATLFQVTASSSPWTLPSHVSMMTSLTPASHQCVLVGGTKVKKRITTLAEILKNEGYTTHAITTILYLTDIYGFEQGFDTLHALGSSAIAEHATDEAVRWINGRPDEPFHLFLHYYDPHADYVPPEPYRSRFDPGYDGPINGRTDNFLAHQDRLTEADRNHLIALYDGEIAYVDHELARVFEALRQRNLWENTLLAVTSDHGEEFMEHGYFGHGFTLYDEQLLVPLIVKWPGSRSAGLRVRQPVQLIDLVPTVVAALDLGGSGRAAGGFEGLSLLPTLKEAGEQSIPYRDAFSQTDLGEAELYANRAAGSKLIYDATSDRWELYNLQRDPAETKNLASVRSEWPAPAQKGLENYLDYARRSMEQSLRAGEKVKLDPKSVEELKSLGYIQ